MRHSVRKLSPLSELSQTPVEAASLAPSKPSTPTFFFDRQDRFVVENYQETRPFSSFLPGIAGLKGTPLWLFYVNRGQGVASFGTQDKDGAILEYLPAHKAYQQAALTGFRTFIKEKETFYEPFSTFPSAHARRRLFMEPTEFEIEEENLKEGWKTNVVYFTLPQEPFAALVRQVTLRNRTSHSRRFELLDGLPEILPLGLVNSSYKDFGHTLQGWMQVVNLESKIPFYKLRASFQDGTEIRDIHGGNFYLSAAATKGPSSLLEPLVDRRLVFGPDTSLARPLAFLQKPLESLLREKQGTCNQVPCGFFGDSFELGPDEELTLVSLIGRVDDIQVLNRRAETLASPAFVKKARRENRRLVEDLCSTIQCTTALPLLDAYARQTYLDNLLRGGTPVFLGGDKPQAYYVYSRRHGDLERDYNFFTLLPEYYSQGNGGFRDVNQNRRMDVWFHPKTRDFNLHLFFSLLQTDGYNPFVVKGSLFTTAPENREPAGVGLEVSQAQKLSGFLEKPFTPGRLLAFLETLGLQGSQEEALFQKILSVSRPSFDAEFKEGYWTDHWVYNLDLLESYLSLYPDQEENLLFGERKYRYFDSPEIVKPRSEKYVLVDGTPRQWEALRPDKEKKSLLEARIQDACWMRTQGGRGPIYETTLYVKMANLAAVKFATLDPLGMGIEMEAGKPGWNDSLNGLPALFASSVSETYELKRLLDYLVRSSRLHPGQKSELPVEVWELLQGLHRHLRDYEASRDPDRDYRFWDHCATERENYRAATRLGFSGRQRETSLKDLAPLWSDFLGKVQAGLNKAENMGQQGLPPTYLRYEPVGYEILLDFQGRPRTDEKECSFVKVLGWKHSVLPPFLEGVVKAMKSRDKDGARALFQKVKASSLYDPKLGMIKVCAPLCGEPSAIGRARSFTPGWQENESIFLHMEYKYLLALLKAGLYEEFFSDFKAMGVPFFDPAVYGRSPLENSSFIVSSANPDPSLHGAGFSARLSGSSAEFLNIWAFLMAGPQPYRMREGRLQFQLSPVLPGWLFDGEGELSFRLFGSCDVTYHNPSHRDSFAGGETVIEKMVLENQDGMGIEAQGGILEAGLALAIRDGQIRKMDVYLKG